ncbi:hypothetical protein CU100_09950 [Phyllobacterium endophyticum]|uniref:Uncharacterized protein n=1 Tax=Phyllobacterium endophyticum TaxID=1149773 RepID=A0A2P7AUU6_9HYPH|nr:hypothetical protein CU100_09950 [Phyllobacterium endophyticum]
MAEKKYEPRQQLDGKWAIYDVSTGLPAVVNGFFTIDMPPEQAEDLSNLLNSTDAKHRPMSER